MSKYDQLKKQSDAAFAATKKPVGDRDKIADDIHRTSDNVKSKYTNGNSQQESTYKHPEFIGAVEEYFDITDHETRNVLMSLSEADQSQMLAALTSKLYDNIVDKVDDINFGDIPGTKGDITKLPNYDKIISTLSIMDQVLGQYNQDTKALQIINTAINNIISRKDMFMKAYRYNIELPMVMYSTLTLSVISATSYMIATCIEFIKTPTEENFNIILDKVAYSKVKENLLYINLNKFNASCKNGDFDKAMDYVISHKVKNLTGTVIAGGIIGSIAVIGILLNIIPILRELVFFFFYSRTRISDYFDAQADLLQMNAYNIEHNNTRDPEEKTRIVNKQLKIVELFRKMSDKLAINNKKSETKATKEIVNTSGKYKSTDVMETMPDSAASSLF